MSSLDLADYFERLAPEDDPRYRHTTEGPDDMPAHMRAALTQTQLSIPVIGRANGARNLAGHLSVRASERAAPAEHRAAPAGPV